MTTTELRHAADAYADENKPTENFADTAKLVISAASSNAKQAFLAFGGGPRPGVYVTEAILHLFARGTWSGSQTITAQRITESWKERNITWRRRPSTTSSNQASAVVGAQSSGDEVTLDVTDLVRQAYLGSGVDFHGIRLSTSASGAFPIHSHEAGDPDLRPFLEITYTHTPTQAFDLVPGDGGIISVAFPVLRWTYYDADENEQAALWVQIDADDTFGSPAYDSGWVVSADPELDLGATAYAGISDGETIYWRVKVRNADGQEGDWADPVAVTRSAKGILTINAPASLTVDPTPEIITTLQGDAQSAISYDLELISAPEGNAGPFNFGNTGTQMLWRKPRFHAPAPDGETFEFEVPRHIIRGKGTDYVYRLTIRSWGSIDERVATPGDPVYVEGVVEFSWVDSDNPPSSPNTLTVTPDPDGSPKVLLQWTIAAVPDFFRVMVDGFLLIDKIPAVDVQLDSTHYELTLTNLAAGTEHDLEVVAVETE